MLAHFAYFLIITYLNLFDAYSLLISLILRFYYNLNWFRCFWGENFFFKKEIPQIFYFVRNYQIDMEMLYNFIYMKSLIFLTKSTYFEVFTHLFNLLILENYHLFFTSMVIVLHKNKIPEYMHIFNIKFF